MIIRKTCLKRFFTPLLPAAAVQLDDIHRLTNNGTVISFNDHFEQASTEILESPATSQEIAPFMLIKE